MAIVNGSIQIAKKDSTWFTANASEVLLDGQLVFNETTSELFIGDGVTQLSSLVAINGGGSQDLASVLGFGNSTGEINITSDDTFSKLVIESGEASIKYDNGVDPITYISAINGVAELVNNNNGGYIGSYLGSSTIAHDLLINLNSLSVKKNNVEIATVNDIVQVNTSTIGSAINGATDATPNDTDLVMSVDTSVAKKNTWTQIKAFLKTYFDTVYQAILVSGTNIKTVGGVSVLGSGDVATPTFTNPIVGTQTQGDNSTKAASTSYVDTAIGAITVRRIHNYQNTDSTTTGSTNETVLANLKVTGGAMGNNGVLSVESFQCKSGSAGSLSWKYYVSTVSTNTVGNTGVPTSSTQIGAGTQSATTLTGGRYLRKMANKNSASTQFMIPTAVTANSDYTSTSITRNAININTANDFYVVVTATLANSADTAILSDIQLNIDKP
jgi:hypothetical protein